MTSVEVGRVVVVGAGHGGMQMAMSLREAGFEGEITLIDQEGRRPYQRPPLSKAFLLDGAVEEDLAFRPDAYFEKHRIDYVSGERVLWLDRAARTVVTHAGRLIPYDHLVLATGAESNVFSVPGAQLKGVHTLRSLSDAEAIRHSLSTGKDMVVIGGGFIGLEIAAAAARAGLRVKLVEAGPRVMGRAVSPYVAGYCQKVHEASGVEFLFNAGVSRLLGADGVVVSVQTESGELIPADSVVVGIGVRPSTQLAEDSGLPVMNGVVVDEYLLTADPNISAIGDCCSFPNPFGPGNLRLESVQNAVDQARIVAERLLGRPAPYAALPWFWSDQGEVKLQMVGLAHPTASDHPVGDVDSGRFSVLRFDGDKLACGESVNKASDHVSLRTILTRSGAVKKTSLDEGLDLKGLARTIRAAEREAKAQA